MIHRSTYPNLPLDPRPIGANNTHHNWSKPHPHGSKTSKLHQTYQSKQHASQSEQTTPTSEQTHWSKISKPHRGKTSRRGLGLALLDDGGQWWPEGEQRESEKSLRESKGRGRNLKERETWETELREWESQETDEREKE